MGGERIECIGCFLTANETPGLFHYSVSRRILEIVVPNRTIPPSAYWWRSITGRHIETWWLKTDELLGSLRRLGFSLILFNGADALEQKGVLELLPELKREAHVGIATTLLHTNMQEIDRVLCEIDYVIINIMRPETLGKRDYKRVLRRFFEKLEEKPWVEAHLHIAEDPEWVASLIPETLPRETPVHIVLYNSMLVKQARRVVNTLLSYGYCNVYLRLDFVGEEEQAVTRCPGCGRILLVRRGIKVSRIGINGTKCPYCGKKVLYVEPLPEWRRVQSRMCGVRVPLSWLVEKNSLRTTGRRATGSL